MDPKKAPNLGPPPEPFMHDGSLWPGMTTVEDLDYIRDKLELNEHDIVSASYPKTGSTWVNEIIFMIANDADIEKVRSTRLEKKLVFIENITHDTKKKGERRSVQQWMEAAPSPRLIKSHCPWRYFKRNADKLEKGCKVVVPTRNPKDTLVSSFHFHNNRPFPGKRATWDEFFEKFRSKTSVGSDMFEYTATFWKVRDHPNVCIVKYEDTHKDTPAMIHRIANFLGKPLSDKQVQNIVEYTSFSHMGGQDFKSERGTGFVTSFFRKGKVGDWRNYFSQEQSDYMDQQCKQWYEPIGLFYDYGTETEVKGAQQ